jgi:oxygen-independent coproporphyrinogen-3 oxidase
MSLEVLEAAYSHGYGRFRENYYLNITYPSLQVMPPIDSTEVTRHLIRPEATPVAIYIHIPFCSARCTYCHYYTLFKQPNEVVSAVLEAIAAELALITEICGSLRYKAIYVGGGTPSILSRVQVESLFTTLEAHGSRDPGCEVSFEMHPEDASIGLMHCLRDQGVTRLSMGVESLDDGILARENRRHSAAQALEAHDLACATGFSTVNLDFIYGLQDQGVREWRTTLERIHHIQPDSLTAYQLRMRRQSAALNRFRRDSARYASAAEALLMHALTQQVLVRESSYRGNSD